VKINIYLCRVTKLIIYKTMKDSDLTKNRKKRMDAGQVRAPYKNKLPEDYRALQLSANSRGQSFNITLEEFSNVSTSCCCFCGYQGSYCIVSLVRVSDGYTADNIAPLCNICKGMMRVCNNSGFFDHVRKVYRYSKLG